MNRSTVLLIALLLVIGAIVLFLFPSEKERETSDAAPEVSISIDSAAVVKLEIQHAPRLMLFENIGGKWTITAPVRYPADPATITRLIGGLSKFKVGSLVSSNPEKQHLFQVDTGGTHVIVTERSGKSTSIIVGKMGPSFSEVYFRLPTSKDVYLGEGIDSWSINKDLKEWRDKTIFAQPTETLRDISITSRGKQYDFHRDSTTWRSGDRFVETSEINPLLNTLSNLRADDFVDSTVKFQLQPVTLSIQGAENVTLRLYPTPPDSSKYIVQTTSSSQQYVVSKYTAQQLMKPIEHGSVGKTVPVASVPSVPKEEEKTTAIVNKKQEKASPPSIIPKKEALPPPQFVETTPPKKTTPKKTSPSKTSQTTSTTATKVDELLSSPPPTSSAGNPSSSSGDDEGELTVHTVKRGETMQSISKQYSVTVEQILKWNLLKSIAVKPGQELYIYIKK